MTGNRLHVIEDSNESITQIPNRVITRDRDL